MTAPDPRGRLAATAAIINHGRVKQRTGKALTEADWSKQINDFLRWRGWEPKRTPSLRVRYPSGGYGWIFCEGHADWLCLRPVSPGVTETFYREDKRPGGKTAAARKATQAAWAEVQRDAGYLVCSMPEDTPDPFLWFCDWYRANFPEVGKRSPRGRV
jgi:hypothetical protein